MTTTAIPALIGQRLQTFVAPGLAALLALIMSSAIPLLGPLLVALLVGAAVANTRISGHRWVRDHRLTTSLMLRLGVVLIGLRLPVDDVLSIGLPGITVIVATVAVTFVATRRLGTLLGLDRPFVTLVAAGFSICDAAAIAALSDAAHARQREVALAVALASIHR